MAVLLEDYALEKAEEERVKKLKILDFICILLC